MASGRIVIPEWMPARDSDGVPIPDAEIFVYLNRTTTLVPVYSDAALTVPLTNPVEANSSGQFPSIWQEDTNLFSVSVFSPSLGVLATLDDVRVSSSAGGGGVSSVNGDAGPAVVLDANDVGAIPLAQKGAPSGVASLGGDGKVPAAQLPVDGSYKGSWNATTNTPTIASGVGVNGDYYIVSVAGTTTIDGISSWAVNDQLRFNGTVWEKFASTATVSSVNAKVGAVVLTAADVGAPTTSGGGVNASAFRTALGASTAGSALFMAANAADQRTLLGLGDSATRNVGTVAGTVAAGDDPRFATSGGIGIRPENYGAVGNASFFADVGTNDAAALQAAINAAIAGNLPLILSRRYRCNSTLTVDLLNPALCRFLVEGTSRAMSGIVFGSNAQIIFTADYNNSEYYPPMLEVVDLAFKTVGQSTTSPILVDIEGDEGGTGNTAYFARLDISGINPTSGFKYGIETLNARNAVYKDIRVLGDRGNAPPGSKAVQSLGGIYIGGDADAADFHIENVEVYFVQKAFVITGASEGATFIGCTVVNCDIGIEDRRGSGVADPLIIVDACHFNTWSKGYIGENRFQSVFANTLFYNFQLYTGWVGLTFINSIGTPSNTSIVGNTFFTFATGGTAIDISGSAGDDNFTIGHNSFDGSATMAVGIKLGSGANRVNIADTNTYTNVTTPIDPGSGGLANSKVHQGIFNIGGGVATMFGAGASENKLAFSEFALPASIYPTTSGTRTLGTGSLRWSAVWGVDASFSGTATVANFGATGTSTFNGPAGFNGGFNVTTGAAISGNTTIGGALTVAGNIQANGGISIASGQSIGQAGGAVYIRDTLYPVTDNTAYCGGGSNRWIAVYAVTGTIQTSDPRLKDMTPIDYDEAERLLFAIQPVSYRWKKDSAKEHMGFNAEEVFEAFQSEGRVDFGGVTERTDDTPMGLNYAELVPVLWAQVRYLTSRLEALERLND